MAILANNSSKSPRHPAFCIKVPIYLPIVSRDIHEFVKNILSLLKVTTKIARISTTNSKISALNSNYFFKKIQQNTKKSNLIHASHHPLHHNIHSAIKLIFHFYEL